MQANINIKVTEDVKDALDRLKLHPREPYHEVIAKLIEVFKILKTAKSESIKDPTVQPVGDYTNMLKEIWNYL